MRSEKEKEGEFWADKLMDLANLEVVVLAFGQLTSFRISWKIFVAGVIIYLVLAGISMKFRQ